MSAQETIARRVPNAADLARFDLFAGTAPDELERLAAESEERRYTPGEIVIQPGEPPDGIYLVVAGMLRIVVPVPGAEGGDDLVISTAPAGDFVGEMGVLDGQVRSATVLAATLCILYFVPAEPFRTAVERSWPLAQRLLRRLCDRVRNASNVAAELASGPVWRAVRDPEF